MRNLKHKSVNVKRKLEALVAWSDKSSILFMGHKQILGFEFGGV